ncbi:MAG: TolC family protein [Candidatus Zixiibacteriota bacterium]
MTALMPVKRIGFLFFPSGNESENVVQALTNLAARQGIEVESEAGYNTKGAYAFFKSYGRLSRDVDIVYLGPMWAMDGSKLTEFFRMLNRSGTPTFVAEGKLLVNKGAVAANTGVSMFGDAYFHARNALEILRGHIPADLPTEFSPPNGLSLNESAARACKLEIARSITDEAIIVPAPPDDTLEYYSIAYCVSRALLQNPGFLSRNDALEAAQQAAQLAGAIWLPHIDGELIATYFDDNAANNALPRLQNEGYSSSLRLRQTLFSLDAVSSMRVARSQQKLEEASLDESRLDLELAVSLAYLDLLNATNLATITRQFRDFVDRQVEVASVKADLGNYERLDVFRLDDEREKATARLNLALSEARIARAMLNALLNLPAETNYVVDTSLFIPDRMLRDYNLLYSPVVSDPAIEALVQFVYDDAQLQDPSLARYDRRLDLQKAMLSKNRARYWPTLSFEAAFRFDDRLADDLPTFEERNSSWSLSGRLRLPLFSGTERAHEHARLSADFSRLEYERDEASLKLMGRTEQLVRRMIAYVRSTPNVRRSAELAVRYFESVRLRYEASDAGLIELLDALDNVYQTAVNDLTNRHRLLTAMAKTVRQAGWSVSTGSGSFDTEFSKRIRERFGR